MATHFDVLSKDQDSNASATPAPQATAASSAATSRGLPAGGGYNSSSGSSTSPEMVVLEDPEVQAAFKDPEVQQLLGELRAGRHLEIHELARSNPRVMQRVKLLLDKGLLSMQH